MSYFSGLEKEYKNSYGMTRGQEQHTPKEEERAFQ